MKGFFSVVGAIAVTTLCWGVYGPALHAGRMKMALGAEPVWIKPFLCVGVAYFLIGVLAAGGYLYLRGETGQWTASGTLWSFFAGAVGALGALGVILAFNAGGRPIVVMPLVFGGAPVINAFLTIWMAKKLKEVGPLFLAGLIMVGLGAVTVLLWRPGHATGPGSEGLGFVGSLAVLLWIAVIILCWGSYGPVLHKGQMKMDGSRLRPLICVGVAYCVVAVLLPVFLLGVSHENSAFFESGATITGTLWSLGAGAAGALGALGVIMAFNFGGKPVYVMPLIFGGAPVVNTLFSAIKSGTMGNIHPLFYAGLILVIAGSAIVLVFAPRGGPPAKKGAAKKEKEKPTEKKPAEEKRAEEKLADENS